MSKVASKVRAAKVSAAENQSSPKPNLKKPKPPKAVDDETITTTLISPLDPLLAKDGGAVSTKATPKGERLTSPFLKIYAEIRVCLAPSFIKTPLDGVRNYLNTFIMRYISELGGVVLAYSNVELTSSEGHIMDESPFSFFNIRALFTLFSPKVGSTLYGVVNKVSPDHIGLLVYGMFNASIPSSHIRHDEFYWDTDGHAWRFSSAKDKSTLFIATNSIVKFTVDSLISANKLLAISGSLTTHPDDTGVVDSTGMAAPTLLKPPIFEEENNMEVDVVQSTHVTFSDEEDEPAENANEDDSDVDDYSHTTLRQTDTGAEEEEEAAAAVSVSVQRGNTTTASSTPLKRKRESKKSASSLSALAPTSRKKSKSDLVVDNASPIAAKVSSEGNEVSSKKEKSAKK
ncbi:hypothetical protein BSLG_007267 [Batrachochytrium salamandrivorans]|nr:hypothetical protein BSLG_007267 [Batrachochytrium salamandrivorans]